MSCSSITENVYHPPTQSSQSGFSVWSTLQITLTPDLMCNISALGVASDSAVRVQTMQSISLSLRLSPRASIQAYGTG